MVPTQWEESDPKCAGAAAALLAPLALESTTAPSPRRQEKVNGARDCCGVWMLATERVVVLLSWRLLLLPCHPVLVHFPRGRYIAKASDTVRLRSFTTKVHKCNAMVSYRTEDD